MSVCVSCVRLNGGHGCWQRKSVDNEIPRDEEAAKHQVMGSKREREGERESRVQIKTLIT